MRPAYPARAASLPPMPSLVPAPAPAVASAMVNIRPLGAAQRSLARSSALAMHVRRVGPDQSQAPGRATASMAALSATPGMSSAASSTRDGDTPLDLRWTAQRPERLLKGSARTRIHARRPADINKRRAQAAASIAVDTAAAIAGAAIATSAAATATAAAIAAITTAVTAPAHKIDGMLRINTRGYLERHDLAELYYVELDDGRGLAQQVGLAQEAVWTGIQPMLDGALIRGYLSLAAASRQACAAGQRYRVYRLMARGLRVASFNDNRDFNTRFARLSDNLTSESQILPDPVHQAAYRRELLRQAEDEVHISLAGLDNDRIEHLGDIKVCQVWQGRDGRQAMVAA